MPRVFITGLGFVTSIGNDAATVGGNLRDLRHGFELYPPFQKPDIPCKVVGTIKGFTTDSPDPEDWTFPPRYTIKRELLRSMAPNGLFVHCAMLQAVADARLAEADVSNPGTGLYAASGGSPFLTHFHHERLKKFGVMRCSPLGIVASIVGTLNFNLVAAFKILGASCGFSSACASSAHALGYAFDDISLGRQKRMFVVGGEDGNADAILPFAGMRTLSLQTDPSLASRPFDAARDGFVGTGGGAVIVLESEDEVARRQHDERIGGQRIGRQRRSSRLARGRGAGGVVVLAGVHVVGRGHGLLLRGPALVRLITRQPFTEVRRTLS